MGDKNNSRLNRQYYKKNIFDSVTITEKHKSSVEKAT